MNIGHAVKDVQDAAAKHLRYKEAGDAKGVETDVTKAQNAASGLTGLIALADPKATPKSDRAAKEKALVELAGALLGKKRRGKELPAQIRTLIDTIISQLDDEGLSADKKRDLVKAGAEKLTQMVLIELGGQPAEDLKSEIGDLVGQVGNMIALYSGLLSDAEKDELLASSTWELLTSKVVAEYLEELVGEDVIPYFEAAKIGYSIGAPIGNAIARDLGEIAKVVYARNVLIALERAPKTTTDASWIDRVATGESIQVSLGEQYAGWTATAYFDTTKQAIRILVIDDKQHGHLLDQEFHDHTEETVALPTETTVHPAQSDPANATSPVRNRVDNALRTARRDTATQQTALDHAAAAADAAGTAWAAAANAYERENSMTARLEAQQSTSGGSINNTRAIAENRARMADSLARMPALWATFQIEVGKKLAAQKTLDAAIVRVLLAAAHWEHWGGAEFGYLSGLAPRLAITAGDVEAAAPTIDPANVPHAGAAPLPKNMSPALARLAVDPKAWVAAGVVAAVLVAGVFVSTRPSTNRPPTAASSSSSGVAAASGAPIEIADNKALLVPSGNCSGTTVHFLWSIRNAKPGTVLGVKYTGPGLPAHADLALTQDGTVSQDFPIAGNGVWASEIVSIGGQPPPPRNATNQTSQSGCTGAAPGVAAPSLSPTVVVTFGR